MGDYWDRTKRYLDGRGGTGPTCPSCGQEMFPVDDHGRFTCCCNMGRTLDVTTGLLRNPVEIPQVDVTGMSDEQKAQIPPINRLHSPMTAAEQNFYRIAAGGVEAMNDPRYWMAGEAIDEERRRASKKE